MTGNRPDLPTPLAGRYVIERELGHGGMATVYLAQDLTHDRAVAVKIVKPEVTAAVGVQRFLREIRATAALSHPNIVPLHDSGEADGYLYYVMPCADGESLRRWLERERQLPLEDVVRVVRELADALDYAHASGVIHRDIKPENILFQSGHAAICDFGIARALTELGGDALTETGLTLGTPSYMSPEQAMADKVDGRTDVYALGCVAYEMLAGEPPHRGPNAQAVIARRLSEAPASLGPVRPGLPDGVEAAICRALARAPADRFRTAGEFAAALSSAFVSPTTSPHAVPRRRRWRAPLIAAGVVVVIAAGWAVLSVGRNAAADLSSSRVAVMPFSVRTGEAHSYLGEGVVDLLSRNLDGIEGLRTVDPGSVLSAAVGTGPLDLERARSIARRVGAGLYVLGSVHASGDRLRFQAQLYGDAAGTRSSEPLAQASVEGTDSEIFALVDRLAVELFVASRRGAPFRLIGAAALTTTSLPALKEYLNAEATLRAGNRDSAISGFQRAVALDTTFALAFYRLAVSAGWNNRHDLADWATGMAVGLTDRLGTRDRRLLEAYAHFRDGDADRAEENFRSLLHDYPDDLEAQFQLADLLHRYNPLRGRPASEARELFDLVLAYDPGFL